MVNECEYTVRPIDPMESWYLRSFTIQINHSCRANISFFPNGSVLQLTHQVSLDAYHPTNKDPCLRPIPYAEVLLLVASTLRKIY